jgi:hypothetical protein
MIRGVWLLVVVVVFASVGAGARYAMQVMPSSYHGSTSDISHGARVGGPLIATPRPSPAVVNGPMEGLAPQDHYPLTRWTLDEARAGEVSQAFIAGPEPAPLGSRVLAADDVLLLSGWAGDALLGLRFERVVFSLCEKVVGWAMVDQPRPDVVRYIHPNLTGSGWTARLPVALLPRCPGAFLSVWAAGPTGVLYPLQGAVPLSHMPAMVKGWAPPGGPMLSPEDMPRLARSTLDVFPPGADLRRCPGADCQAVASLKAGTQLAARLEHADGWSLVITQGKAGWIADGAFRWRSDGGIPPGLPEPLPKPILGKPPTGEPNSEGLEYKSYH